METSINNGWRIVKFKDCITQLNTGLNPRDNFTLGNGSIKYITAKNLTKHGRIDFTKCDYIDERAKRIINKRSDIRIGDILFSSRAPIGQCHLIKEEPKSYDIGESIFAIRVNKEVVLPEYLCLYLASDYFVKAASKHTTGSIILEIRVGDLMNTDVIVPPKKVQESIAIITNQPYSINGILSFLRATHVEEEWNLFDSLEVFYKMCHGYTHGNVGFARFPLLHYFEVSIILHLAISHTYTMLCEDLEVDSRINDIDILEKAEEEFVVLNEQYQKKSTELFERHHKK